MSQDWLLGSADALAAQLPDGAKIAVPHDTLGVAMETTRALIRRGAKNLHVVCVPIGGLQVDLLVGAGCVATLETSAVTFGEHGTPWRFHDALKRGAIRMLDATLHPVARAAGQRPRRASPGLEDDRQSLCST
jgi:glutaconate CoA-transferase subunit A